MGAVSVILRTAENWNWCRTLIPYAEEGETTGCREGKGRRGLAFIISKMRLWHVKQDLAAFLLPFFSSCP